MRDDMTALGLQPIDLARRCRVATSTITRFFNGRCQTARVAKRIARALRQDLDRYVIRSSGAAA
jgi:transcriptional regulator with XRE-family HTH domain